MVLIPVLQAPPPPPPLLLLLLRLMFLTMILTMDFRIRRFHFRHQHRQINKKDGSTAIV